MVPQYLILRLALQVLRKKLRYYNPEDVDLRLSLHTDSKNLQLPRQLYSIPAFGAVYLQLHFSSVQLSQAHKYVVRSTPSAHK